MLKRVSKRLRGHEHRKNEEQQSKIEQQETKIVIQQKQIEALTVTVKEQAAQIQKVSDQIELTKFATGRIRGGGPAPQIARNNH
jgi:hypothetical protein